MHGFFPSLFSGFDSQTQCYDDCKFAVMTTGLTVINEQTYNNFSNFFIVV